MEDLQQLFNEFSSVKVGIIGDVMLDTYMWGNVERISPEAPVPVVSLIKKDYRIGGAGNVALNIQSLGAKAFVLSVTGKDDDSVLLKRLFQDFNIDCSYSVESADRITTNKIRVIARNQQMLRLDGEVTTDLNGNDEEQLIKNVTRFISEQNPEVVILQDYNKGVLTLPVIESVIRLCNEKGIIVSVDTKRKNFFAYKNVNIFKPNLKEVQEALNILNIHAESSFLSKVHQELKQSIHHDISLITLSEKGIFYENDEGSAIIPSHIRRISDVSGAGDTVIAVASLVYAVSRNIHLMAEMANIAGGLVCEEVGTVAVDKWRLQHECEILLT